MNASLPIAQRIRISPVVDEYCAGDAFKRKAISRVADAILVSCHMRDFGGTINASDLEALGELVEYAKREFLPAILAREHIAMDEVERVRGGFNSKITGEMV
jgi:hypothetical protein